MTKDLTNNTWTEILVTIRTIVTKPYNEKHVSVELFKYVRLSYDFKICYLGTFSSRGVKNET